MGGLHPSGDIARLIAVISAEAGAAVVERPGAARQRAEALGDGLDGPQARFLRLLHHPEERDVAEALVGIAAADVGMHAGEPDLLEAPGVDPARLLLSLRRLDRAFLVHLVPRQRVEGIALIVDGEGVAGAANAVGKRIIGHAQRDEPFVDSLGDLRDRAAIGRHRVPNADELDDRVEVVWRARRRAPPARLSGPFPPRRTNGARCSPAPSGCADGISSETGAMPPARDGQAPTRFR